MKTLFIALLIAVAAVPASGQLMDTTTRANKTIYSLRLAARLPRREVVASVSDILGRNGGYLTYANPELGAVSGEAWYDLDGRRAIAHVHVTGDGDSLYVTAFYTTDDTGPDKLDRAFEYGPLKRILLALHILATKPK